MQGSMMCPFTGLLISKLDIMQGTHNVMSNVRKHWSDSKPCGKPVEWQEASAVTQPLHRVEIPMAAHMRHAGRSWKLINYANMMPSLQ